MKKLKKLNLIGIFLGVIFLCSSCTSKKNDTSIPTLKNGIGRDFLIGVAITPHQVSMKDSIAMKLVSEQFNCISPENCMKSENIHPEENYYYWDMADQYVNFGVKHNMFVIGHCLIWHSQLSPWFCVDKNGNNVSPEVLKKRIKNHITTIVSRYQGQVNGWDVVNEALLDDGSYRNSKFYQILGEEFIPFAFKCAHEADPKAELYYNDYSMTLPAKQKGVLHIVKTIRDYGAPITGIGMQSHYNITGPSAEEVQTAIDTLAKTGCKLMITELDLSALPFPENLSGAGVEQDQEYLAKYNPYPESLPDSAQTAWNNQIKSYFDVFKANKDKISRITVWGLTDSLSWRNNWPIQGRRDYATLFDRHYKAKEFTKTLMK